MHDDTMPQALVLLAALLVFVPLFRKLRIGTVIAYLVAGLAIGPATVGLIPSVEHVEAFAELGVVFLLFTVGLEINVERLRLFGVKIFLIGFAQVAGTTVALTGVGIALGLDARSAFAVGIALSFSSTAVVLQLLSERGQLTGAFGRTVVAILLVQDLMVAPAIVVVAATSSPDAGLLWPLTLAVAQFAVVVTLFVFAERTVLRPLLRWAADSRTPEVFTAATLLLVLGTGWAAEQAGLTMALGAFLAGMLVADTEFRHQVAADIQPFRGLLLGLFFMTVGMGIDLRLAYDHIGILALLVVGILGIKTLVLLLIGVVFRLPRARAIAVGALLAQSSEFSFVVLALAMDGKILDPETGLLLEMAVALTMAATPFVAIIAPLAALDPDRGRRASLGNLRAEMAETTGHVVIAGFGQVGMAVARYLAGERVPTVILDLNAKRVMASRARGLPVFFGNASRMDVLRACHLERAAALVLALPEAKAAEQITEQARRAYPRLRIFVRVPEESWIRPVRAAGADAVVLDGLTTALELAERVMTVYSPETTDAK